MGIPKIIHYCWFGGKEMPDVIKRCMATWDILAKGGYVFKRWDETNCSFEECDFVKKAYREEKWGFIGDYYRAKALYTDGGIYLDTDVFVHAIFDDLLELRAFLGFFVNIMLCTAVVGAEKGNTFIKKILDMYETGKFETDKTVLDGSNYIDIYQKEFRVPSNDPWTWCMIKNYSQFELNNKKQIFSDVTVFPKEYFEAGSVFGKWYTIHLNTGEWKNKNELNRFALSGIKNKNELKLNMLERHQKLWSLFRKIQYRKAQKNSAFYRNLDRIMKTREFRVPSND